MEKIKVYAQRQPWMRSIGLLFEHKQDNVVFHGKITFENYKDGDFVQETAVLDYDSAQQLMDELWQCGLRPSEGTGSAGSLAATEKHLEDMRKIVFKNLDLK